MSFNAEKTVTRIAEDHPTKNEPAQSAEKDETFDETVLDGYITENNQIAPEIIDALRSNNQTARLEAATKLHRLVDKRETTSIQPIISSGLMPDIVSMISLDDAELQVPLAVVLVHLTAESSETISAVVEAGAIAKCILLTSSSTSDLARDNALMSLGNIGGYSQPLNDRVIQEGGLKPLLNILASPSEHKDSHKYWAANAIAGITHQLSSDVAGYEVITQDMITVLTKYIEYKQDETAGSLRYSLLALSHILSNESSIHAVLETKIIPRIVQLCSSEHANTRHDALECVGNILYSSEGAEHLTKAGAIEALMSCIGSEDAQDRVYACWAAANIAAITSTLEQVKALMKAGFVPMLVKAISNLEEEAEAQSNAAWALAGLAYNWGQFHREFLRTLLEANCVEGLLSALALKDQEAVAVSIKGLLVFLETWGLVKQDAMERIQAADGVGLLRVLKLRPEAGFAHERFTAHMILKKYFNQFSLPPRV
ncbi:hypothetical protein M407DRAFT_25277 [Tulasnella calospora MUT 4182]|uniref:Importin subunit alpha n=1 Tax=Tulasnella calospora MUT 4182 TaxID=1051891 RepID=A0A0C3QHU4_9AGAM|nr:hypothetical protein M407DRAFT_25277 [Tulasnella calospora MUT 4182]